MNFALSLLVYSLPLDHELPIMFIKIPFRRIGIIAEECGYPSSHRLWRKAGSDRAKMERRQEILADINWILHTKEIQPARDLCSLRQYKKQGRVTATLLFIL